MAFNAEAYPSRVNLGCGFDQRDGYLNVDFQDFHEPDLVADVRELTMLPDAGYTEVLAFDVLEHLPRHDTARACAEWYRICAPGGVMRCRVPNVLALARRLAEVDDARAQAEVLHLMFGTQAYSGDFHLAGFTDVTLVDALATAGFRSIELENQDDWMLDATARRPGPGVDTSPLAVSYAGLYPVENDGTESFRWSSTAGELCFVNTDSEPLRAAVSLSLACYGPPRTVQLRSDLVRRDVDVADRTPVDLSLQVPPGVHRIALTSDGPLMEVPGETRRLCFMVRSLAVTVTAGGAPAAATA